MQVTVRAFANLQDYAPGRRSRFELELPEGATVADLLAELRVPSRVEVVLLVNGRRAEPGTAVSAGDEITLFPPMEGG